MKAYLNGHLKVQSIGGDENWRVFEHVGCGTFILAYKPVFNHEARRVSWEYAYYDMTIKEATDLFNEKIGA